MNIINYLIVFVSFISVLHCQSVTSHDFDFLNSIASVKVLPYSNWTQIVITKNGQAVQSIDLDVIFGANIVREPISGGFTLSGNGKKISFTVLADAKGFALVRIARTLTKADIVTDCIDLGTLTHWYGGPQQRYQYWPIEKLKFSDYSYVTKEADNAAITERYWLNTHGIFVYVEDEAPLFIDQNSLKPGKLCLRTKKQLPYDTYSNDYVFNYQIGIGVNARTSHLEAVNRILKKPSGYPDERMVRYPIWSTWAKYKRDINDSVVRTFANEITTNNFTNSQYEIDDDWEICYGALTFNEVKFPNVTELVTWLKSRGFRVTLWIHPFINKGCEPWYTEAKTKNYLVLDHAQNPDTQWWNSNKGEAAYIDFTKTEAAAWFTNRLLALQNKTKIDSFKFDAGETSWSPIDPILQGTTAQHPSRITTEYIKTVAKFGSMVEVRSGQGTQNLPIFLRMIDKDSEWTWNNGLPTLVTTLLQLNMAGYPLVLPDMIGGNGYDNHPPSKEMFIRWLAANVFMPSLQYSFVPWDYDMETIAIAKNFNNLHANYSDYIIERFKLAVSSGDPVNPPLWWIDPADRQAQAVYDQFLLGDDIIAAPVLVYNQRARNIYLPRGNWKDGNTNEIYRGPTWLRSYPAPLNILPWFIRVK